MNHVYAQIVDDRQGITLAAASSLDPDIRRQKDGKAKTDVSKLVGGLIARRAKEKGVNTVVFDRGGYKFHGRLKSLAGGAREGGLVF
jgi:large subunit ribosomal protein L18